MRAAVEATTCPCRTFKLERTDGEAHQRLARHSTDHIIVLGEAHLRRVLKSYATYDNAARTHR